VVEWFGPQPHRIVVIQHEAVASYAITDDAKAGDGETLPTIRNPARANLPEGRIPTLAQALWIPFPRSFRGVRPPRLDEPRERQTNAPSLTAKMAAVASFGNARRDGCGLGDETTAMEQDRGFADQTTATQTAVRPDPIVTMAREAGFGFVLRPHFSNRNSYCQRSLRSLPATP
jgi:hypothetical protein